jgi:predicted nucleic acid-binding protein
MIYALDTNIISYFIQGNSNVAVHWREALARGDSFVIPPVTYYEIRRGFRYKSAPGKERAFAAICAAYLVGEMNTASWECAAGIYGDSRRNGNPIEDDDILIAAFCAVGGFTLVTHNVKHFGGIDGLRIEDWAAK